LKLGIIVDHPKRDLPGALMIAGASVARGHAASIVPLYEQGSDVPLLALDALIVNFARPANLDLVAGYRAMGLPVYVLDTEGGVLTDTGANSPAKLADYVRTSGFAGLLAGYFFWGSRLRDAFAAGSGLPADRLRATGCPRFDYATPRWWDLLEFERSGYVLVNANFPLVNPLFVRSPEEERDSLVRAGWDPAYVDGLIADLRQILDGYLRTVRQAAAACSDLPFLVRPHPFENGDTYRRAFADVPNVVVDGRGSVLNVIHNARCVVHLNCGTSIEATMLRRLPVSMEFLNTPLMARHGPLPSRISHRVGDAEELVQTLRDVDARTAAFPFEANYAADIHPWFHDHDGAAADRIVAAIESDLGGARRRLVDVRGSLGSSRRQSRLGQRLQALAANAFGSLVTSRWRARATPVRGEKSFGAAEVRRGVERIAAHARLPAPACSAARHPWTGVPLASVDVLPG
jgi:surface carbohydrate biosynthesis protein